MNKITMLHSEFSIEKLFPINKEEPTIHQFKTFPFSELIDIKKSKTTCQEKKLNHPGIYIFWWVGTKKELEGLNRKILIKGKVDQNGKFGHHYHQIDFSIDWFPKLDPIKYALYVGKSTNISKRFQWHLKIKTTHETWLQNMNDSEKCESESDYFRVYSPTTSCQFRSGIELLLKNSQLSESEFWKFLQKNIAFSFLTFDDKDSNGKNKDLFVAERFYLEDYLIGALRPWFNIDSER